MNVESQQRGEGVLEIFDFSGKLIYILNPSFTNGFNQISLDVSSWQTGVYYAKLHLPNGQQQIGKIVKE